MIVYLFIYVFSCIFNFILFYASNDFIIIELLKYQINVMKYFFLWHFEKRKKKWAENGVENSKLFEVGRLIDHNVAAYASLI